MHDTSLGNCTNLRKLSYDLRRPSIIRIHGSVLGVDCSLPLALEIGAMVDSCIYFYGSTLSQNNLISHTQFSYIINIIHQTTSK